MKFQYFIIFFVSAILTSCTDVIQLELEDPEPVFVVDGYLTDQDTLQWVRLRILENYFANTPPNYAQFKDATVYLLENSVIADTYSYNPTNERFEINYQGINGNEYQVHITLPDGSGYISAAEVMESVAPIDSIWVTYLDSGQTDFTKAEITVSINFQEPAGLGDNYQWKTYVNDDYNSGPFDIIATSDDFFDGIYIDPLDIYGMTYEEYNKIKASSVNGLVFIKIEQGGTTLRYSKFLALVSQQIAQGGSPFSSPPAEISGNVYKKGEDDVQALGYFYTTSVSSKTIEILP